MKVRKMGGFENRLNFIVSESDSEAALHVRKTSHPCRELYFCELYQSKPTRSQSCCTRNEVEQLFMHMHYYLIIRSKHNDVGKIHSALTTLELHMVL